MTSLGGPEEGSFGRLASSVGSLKLAHPVMLASGIMGTSASSLIRMAKAGACAVVTKSLGIEERDGYPNPTVIEVNGGLLNAIGLSNPSVNGFIPELNILKQTGITTIVSIFGSLLVDKIRATLTM